MLVIEMVVTGFILDLFIGDPPSWPHPVKLMGQAIAVLTRWWNRPSFRPRTRQWLGGALWVIMVGGTVLVTGLLMWASHPWPWLTYLIGSYLSYTCLSIRGLAVESRKIIRSLAAANLTQARQQVGMIVGRDTNQLSEQEVAKATIETVAENTSDGVIAPMLYLLIGGPVLGLAYKAVNTLDSMVGYQNEQYADFGRVSAQLDDVVNYLPARITWLLLLISSWGLRFDAQEAWQVGRQDRLNHRSPNSGFSESVVAGALHLQLGGTHTYFGQLVTKPTIGRDHGQPVTLTNIQQTLTILYTTASVGLVLFVGLRYLAMTLGGMSL